MLQEVFCPCVFSYQNKGDALLVCSLLQALRARYGPTVRITLASLHPDIDRDWYGAPVGPEPLRRLRDAGSTRWALLAVLTSWLFVAVASLWARFPGIVRILPREWRFVLEAARAADLAVSVPGGYLMAPTRGAYWWLSHFCALWACIATRTPLVLAPCSIGPFVRRYRPLARRLLSRVDLIVLRESRSLEFLRELGVDDRRILLGADMGFAYRPETRAAPPKRDRPAVGLSVRRWDFPGQADPSALWDAYVNSMSRLVDWLVTDLQVKVVFVPQAVGAGGDDPVVSRLVRERSLHSRDVDVLQEDLDLADLRSLYQSLDLLVGTRMHANLLAMTAGVPVVAIAYEVKTQGIMEQLGMDRYVMDIGRLRTDELIALVAEAWHRRQALREHIRRRMAPLRRQALAWLDELDHLVARHTRGSRR